MRARKLYQFTCAKCGNERRQSFKRTNAEIALCRKFRRETLTAHLTENQMSIFEEKPHAEEDNKL